MHEKLAQNALKPNQIDSPVASEIPGSAPVLSSHELHPNVAATAGP